MPNNISILNQEIRIFDNLYCLNDLHKASGGAEKHKPANFLRLDTTQDLIVEIEKENLNCSDVSNKKIAFKSIAGRFGGSYGCKELVYAYAMWISAKFHLTVIRVFDNQHQKTFDPAKMSRGDILRLALDAEEENQKLTAQIEADKPKVEFAEKHNLADGWFCLRDAAKQVGCPPRKFNDWLHAHNYIFRQGGKHWMPYSEKIKAGLFKVKSGIRWDENGEEIATQQCMVTAKGIQHFTKLLEKEGVLC